MDGGIITKTSVIDEKGLGEEVIKLRFDGLTQEEIASRVGVDRKAVQRYLDKHKDTSILRAKGQFIYEINRTIAESHLSQQLAEFEKNYYNSMQRDDEKAAYAWSQRWGEALDKILKVTGAYQSPPVKVEPIQININWKAPIKR